MFLFQFFLRFFCRLCVQWCE